MKRKVVVIALPRLSQFAVKKDPFWARIVVKVLLFKGQSLKMACSADPFA
ncbi:MAG: hypothetical protein OZ917_08340 [Candidatus Brocadiaceae bacterium]|nr:hypothetical protein [Candidatus Brocadiaceae bacterium]